jgi:hypothetical protein
LIVVAAIRVTESAATKWLTAVQAKPGRLHFQLACTSASLFNSRIVQALLAFLGNINIVSHNYSVSKNKT